jgi:hypothetical protein
MASVPGSKLAPHQKVRCTHNYCAFFATEVGAGLSILSNAPQVFEGAPTSEWGE